MFNRIVTVSYGVICYAISMATFVVAMGFLANVGVPKSLDSAAYSPFVHALAVDLSLLLLFSVQHSVMARRGFKRAWTRIVPPAVDAARICYSAAQRCCSFSGSGSRWAE